MLKKVLIVILLFITMNVYNQGVGKQFLIDKDYLNYPIQNDAESQKMFLISGDDTLFYADIRIAENELIIHSLKVYELNSIWNN